MNECEGCGQKIHEGKLCMACIAMEEQDKDDAMELADLQAKYPDPYGRW